MVTTYEANHQQIIPHTSKQVRKERKTPEHSKGVKRATYSRCAVCGSPLGRSSHQAKASLNFFRN